MQYIDSITGGTNSISKNSMLNTPLPVVVFRGDNGEVVWANNGFLELSGARDDVFNMHIDRKGGCKFGSISRDSFLCMAGIPLISPAMARPAGASFSYQIYIIPQTGR